MLAMLLISFDEIVKPKQVWICSPKAEDPGNSCERCHLHKALVNSICLQVLFSVFYSSDEWWICGRHLSPFTSSQKKYVFQFQREAYLLSVSSLPSQTLGLELNISKTQTSQNRTGQEELWCFVFYVWRQSCWNYNASPHCHFDNILFWIIFSLESYHSAIFWKTAKPFFIF